MTYKKTKIIIVSILFITILITNFMIDHHSDLYYLIGQLYFIELILVGMWFYEFSVYGALILSSVHLLYHAIFEVDRLVQVSVESFIFVAISILIYMIQKIRHKNLVSIKNYIDATRMGTWEWDLLKDKVVYNNRWYEILGYKNEDFMNHKDPVFINFIHPEDLSISDKYLRELLEGKREYYDIKIRMKHKDGYWAWIHDQGKITKWTKSGKPWIVSGSHSDITEDVKTQEAIKYQKERFNRIIEHSPDIIYELDLELNIIAIYGEFTKKYKIMHLIGKRVDTFASGEENKQMHVNMTKKALEGDIVTYEWDEKFRDERFYFESSLARIMNDKDEIIGIVGIARNITTQKMIEFEKEFQEDLLRYIVETSMNSIAIFDSNMNYVFVSDKFKDENNISNENIIGKNHYDLFPEIQEKFREIHQKSLKGETFSSDRDSIVRQDGHIDWISWECRPWYNQQGEVGGIVLSTFNLEEQMKLEVELQNYAHQLTEQKNALDATLQSIGEAVIATDSHGLITVMNKQAEVLTGTTFAEANKKPFDQIVLISDEFNQPQNGKSIAYVLRTKERLENESKRFLTNVHGITYPIEKTTAPILNNNQEAIGVVIVIRDITDSYKKQQEIEYLSMHDYLTNLYNRRYFVQALDKFDDETYYPLGLMMVDLNGLKLFNDAYGHDIGDLALVKVSSILTRVFNQGEVVSRIGGDEFAIIIKNTSMDYIESKKVEIREQLKGVLIENISLTIAIGYELKKESTEDTEEILRIAENYMYRNKLSEGHSFRNHAIKAILKTLTDKYEAERMHSFKVSEYVVKIGQALGLKLDDIKELELAGLYHDIGKISVPDAILDKPGRLTDEEYEKIKLHTEVGYQILKAADEYSNLAEYALSHHERWDGKGYPRGLKEKGIPLFSRIIAVADSYEAMTADRVYRKKLSDDEAVNEIRKCAGSQFDPKIAKVFVEKVLNKPWK
ncbi:MAG: PAS domain S-box protein [Acholeplasmataceae bacterium]|jgi:diguanylate cyclase (GGDEF)-like protein/PAS domain S-box-containing protein/putative nucleotidyltransferase with HDIG domain|nr:PAS domain S-box protein [Acholeplasmataceae bacterium]